MLRLLLYCIFLIGSSFIPSVVFAQKGKKKPEKVITYQEFNPIAKSLAIEFPTMEFKNINILSYYYDKEQLSLINLHKKDKNWEQLFPILYTYVNNFGIRNFIDDIGLMWDLAKLADHLGKKSLAKELYRYLIKHYRGNLEVPILYFDSLVTNEKKSYVKLEEYYQLIEKWELVDSLKPSEDMRENMGEGINSNFAEYGLTIAGNDSVVYFTSVRREENGNKSEELKPKEDENLFVSYRSQDSTWSQAKPISDVNSEYNEGSPCISPDGRSIVFARCYSPDGLGNCDLYMALWNEETNSWDAPFNMGKSINTPFWESHPTFSITGDTIFFASDRKGGFGGTDIFYSVKADKRGKSWYLAQNIGATINTQRNEVSPFIHPQTSLLYFSSDGHLVNFGSFDIFKSYPSGTGKWSEPKNVGPFINGEGSEFYFTIDRKSKYLYYARSKTEKDKNSDLFSFPLPMGAQPFATVKFSGKIVERYSGETFDGIVALFDLDYKIPIEPKYVNADGSFEFQLIDKRRYMLIVTGENFFRLEEIFFLEGDTKKEMPIQSIETVQFKSIEFTAGSAKLLPEMENDLHLIISFLKEHTNFHLSIEGHTDGDGMPEANIKLSQARADAIKAYLVAYGGILESRIQAVGYGSSKPLISPEKTEEEKRINRRVEFRLSKAKI